MYSEYSIAPSTTSLLLKFTPREADLRFNKSLVPVSDLRRCQEGLGASR